MKRFHEWIIERELIEKELNEGKMGWLGAGAMALASMFPSTAKAQNPTQPPAQHAQAHHQFSGTKLLNLGASERKLQDDEIFINAWTVVKHQFTNNMNAKPYITDFYMDVTTEDHAGKKIAVVEIRAKIIAPDREHAKGILIYEIMKESGKHNMQGIAIKALKDLNLKFQNEQQQISQKFPLQLVVTPENAYFVN